MPPLPAILGALLSQTMQRCQPHRDGLLEGVLLLHGPSNRLHLEPLILAEEVAPWVAQLVAQLAALFGARGHPLRTTGNPLRLRSPRAILRRLLRPVIC